MIQGVPPGPNGALAKMGIRIHDRRIGFVGIEFTRVLQSECDFPIVWIIIIIRFIYDFGSMLDGIQIANVFPCVCFERKHFNNVVSERLLFLNTEEHAVGVAVTNREETHKTLHQ